LFFPRSFFLIFSLVPSDCISLLINHIHEIKKIPELEISSIIVVPESNLAFEGIWIAQELYRSGTENICIMREDENRAGVKINNSFKKLMKMAIEVKLNEKTIFLYNNFISIGELSPDEMKEELIVQLLNYTRMIKPSKDPHKAPTEIFGGKSGHGFDDLVIALQINYVMRNRFNDSDKYIKWK